MPTPITPADARVTLERPRDSVRESKRLAALYELQVLDTAPEEDFDKVTALAASLTGMPIALISLVDRDRQWFKSRHGLNTCETARDIAFCDHAIRGDALFEICDATKDTRFRDNPLVTGALQIRHYAGVPLKTGDGYNVGTLCVIGTTPGELSPIQRQRLSDLATLAEAALERARLYEKRRINEALTALLSKIQIFEDRTARSESLDEVIRHLLVLTNSRSGFIGYVYRRSEDTLGVRIKTATGNDWQSLADRSFPMTGSVAADGNTLQRALHRTVLERKHVLENNPDTGSYAEQESVDTCIENFCFIPVFAQGNVRAVIGLSGRSGGYNSDVIRELHPVQVSLSNITESGIAAWRQEKLLRKLRHSKDRLTLAINAGGIGLRDWDLSTGKVTYSQSWQAVVGYSASDLGEDIGQWQDLVHPDDASQDLEAIQKYLTGQTDTYDAELRVRHKDGRWLWLSAKGGVTDRHEDGMPKRVVCTYIDITSQKRTEQEIRQEKEFLTLAEKVGGVGHWRIDLTTNSLFWSDEIFRIHNVTPETYTPDVESAIAFYHPDDVGFVREAIDKAISRKEPFAFEFRLVQRGGAIRNVRSRSQLQFDTNGEVSAIFGIFMDITEEVRMREQVARSEERFALAASGASVGIWDWQDVNDEREWWSPIFYDLIGYTPDELPASVSSLRLLLHPADSDRTFERVRAHFENRTPYRAEFRLKHKTKGFRWFLGTGQAVWDSAGAPIRMIGSIMDIHDLKQTQEDLQNRTAWLERANADLDSFAHVASHDLRAPLRGIQSVCQWLQEDLQAHLDQDAEENFALLRGRVRRMDQLLTDILTFSKAGKQESDPERVCCTALVNEISDWLAVPAGITITSAGLPEIVTSGSLVQQVFTNLLSNAVKHHDRDHGSIRVEYGMEGAAHKFSVIDDGPGIDPAFQERIFEMFQTLKPRDEVEGSGIGLAIVKRTLESCGGRIWLESPTTDRGTAFHFTIPEMDITNQKDPEDVCPRKTSHHIAC